MMKNLLEIFNWLFRRKRYKTQWVADLPSKPRASKIYVVGGREYPFQVVLACPNAQCSHLIYLDIAPEATPRWKVTEHQDGSLSLSPSIFLTKLPCRSHFWVRMGRIQWTQPTWINRIKKRK